MADGIALAAEVWEGVLQSVAKTVARRNRRAPGIVDLDAYLFGVFHHRFNRALKKERRRQETIELVPSTRDLEQLPGAHDAQSPRNLERSLQVNEVVRNMDDWTRRVWTAKQYGYSWREIAEQIGLSEQAAKARFHNALRKLAARLRYGK
ncbi:MAG TPA: sigma-70 family RNA polymerase sigma factor [Candidatus Binatia bacterium]|nr:sigma-70 family RNA polymerase sigma factor [Candidatus Binatia bacterium]